MENLKRGSKAFESAGAGRTQTKGNGQNGRKMRPGKGARPWSEGSTQQSYRLNEVKHWGRVRTLTQNWGVGVVTIANRIGKISPTKVWEKVRCMGKRRQNRCALQMTIGSRDF